MNRLSRIYWAYRNKVTNKVWGTARMPAQGEKRGDVLLSYFTEPFTLGPGKSFSNFHTMYWECYEIARLFSERGYAIDIVNAKEKRFVPQKPYKVCIDTEDNLERFIPHFPKACKKVFHILISHWDAYNAAEKSRLDALEKRRGLRLAPQRSVPPSRDAELADFLEGFGNRSVFRTFERFSKPITFIPISTVKEFDFPAQKDFAKARKSFVWFGGGGAVLKGLDLVLEAFALMPDLELHVCGPVGSEKDFVNAYRKELFETPNIHVHGRIDVASPEFSEIVSSCAALVYPSGGEGSSGAVVQAMHAGIMPIITHETGIQEDSGYIPLVDPTPESVRKAVRDFSELSPDEVRERSRMIWEYARRRYTRAEFSRAYAEFIDTKIDL